MEKRIERCTMRAGDIKTGFGNPRKIIRNKMDELEQSFEMFGDFGIYLIDEQDNIIAGNQRLKVVLRKYGPDVELDCKRLIGYTEAELRAINIKDNTHAGEWDLDLLADWTADLTLDLGIDPKEAKKNPETDYMLRFSLPYVAAVALVHGKVSPWEIDMELARDIRIRELMGKVTCIADDEKRNPGYFHHYRYYCGLSRGRACRCGRDY